MLLKDKLIIRQIAERRQALEHYEKSAGSLAASIENNEVKVEKGTL